MTAMFYSITFNHRDINGVFGFVAEVDIFIPESLHERLDDLPLAPERKCTSKDLTPLMTILWSETENKSYKGCQKLLLTHDSKEKYVVHFALLQFYQRMGVKILKIHRAVTFTQSHFFKEYHIFLFHL